MKVRMIVVSLFIMMALSACAGRKDIGDADGGIPKPEDAYTEEDDKNTLSGDESMTYRTEEETGDGKGDERNGNL